uniref:(California timema) hypothetical protein n=1 Tax=Timema californicum TaxID=61474 RepID=A0A7R9PFC8_TIMCA|nr:unnamed protein product [Timema californicum]
MLHRFLMDSETVLWLAEMCDGDARIALNSLQLALQSRDTVPGRILMISLDDIKDGVKRSHLLYDKKGEEHYNIISAMHKSIRASDDNAALYWLTRMLQGGEDPVFIARRLVRAASEDIGTIELSARPGTDACNVCTGIADPMAVTMAVSAMQACQLLGLPECDVHLAQCAVFLARYMDTITIGYGKGYNTAHKEQSNLLYMPEGLEDVNFFL